MILCFKAKTLLLAVYYSTIRSLSSQMVPNSISFTEITHYYSGLTLARKVVVIIIVINNCLKPYSPLTFQAENTSIIM